LSQREHILARPEPYLGGVDAVTEPHWVLLEPAAVAALADAGAAAAAGAVTAIAPPKKVKSARELDECAIVESVITYTPALYKLFDEILVNACDNVHRAPARGQPAMSHVAVSISPSDGAVSVENDGAAIPVVMHDKEGVWVPELIFGHLLTSSNYDDSVARFTGGRHGFGAKLTNIFSRSFTVEITDAERGKRYSQTFRDNMATTEPAAITEAPTGARSSTRITFTPDLTRLLGPAAGKTLPADTVRLMRRRVFDAAACLGPRGVVVTLDGHRVPVRSFSDYLAQCPAFCGASGVGVSDDADAAAAEAADADDSATATAVEDDARRGKLTIAEVDDHWLVAVGPRYDDPLLSAAAGAGANAGAAAAAAGLRQISFVNGIATSRGGTHVAFIMDQIARHLAAYLTEGRRRKRFGLEEGTEVPLGLVRAHTSLLVSCLVPNPSFDSQTKDVLLTPLRGEGRRVALAPGASTSAAALREAVDAPALPAKLLDRIARTSGICEAVADVLRVRQAREDRKKLNAALGKGARTGRRQHLNIDKLDDANLAGTNKSSECTLILTEGDSAKALALSGLAVVGRERYGVFPLRGKLLNVRDATVTAVQRNKELTEVAEILGLRFGVDYSTAAARASLRYGRVMLMADQDHDGSHIKGLFLNIIDCFWPSLLQSNAFMQEFITPIVKATPVGGGAGGARDGGFVARTGDTAAAVAAAAAAEKPAGKGKGKVASAGVGAGGVLSFYSLPDYNKWKGSLTEEQLRRWRVKYYKGLGTSTAAEGREYFSRLGAHVISFAHDGDASAAALDLAFNKAKADDRKAWLLTEGLDEAGTELVPAVANGVMGITEFVNRELVHFSRADTVRSIPSLVDGLKPGQARLREALFCE
jgi:DNA topoisomerase-2